MSARFNYLNLVETASLRLAVMGIEKAFPDAFGAYHVGSSLTRADYRDVDVRLILKDAQFEHLFGAGDKSTGHFDFWSLTCLSLSEWLRARTGLPVDFQITSLTEAQKYKGEPRNALFVTYPKDVT